MSRVPQKKQYTEKQNRCIYIILNPKTKEFYIDYTLNEKENLRCAFKAHRTEKRPKTLDMIQRAKNHDVRPCFFKLDERYCTKVEAYHAVIGWTKIFVEQGYINVDHGNIECYIEDIFGEAEAYYKSKKDVAVTKLFTCECCLSPCKPKKDPKPKVYTQHVQIKLLVSEEEKLQIQTNARAANKTVSAFIREMALDAPTVELKHHDKIVRDHAAEISVWRNGILQLVYTIQKINDYSPAYLETIYELMQKICQSEKDFLKKIEIELAKERKILKAQVASIANERFDELINNKSEKSKVNS